MTVTENINRKMRTRERDDEKMRRKILTPKIGTAVMTATIMMSICSPVMAAGTSLKQESRGHPMISSLDIII